MNSFSTEFKEPLHNPVHSVSLVSFKYRSHPELLPGIRWFITLRMDSSIISIYTNIMQHSITAGCIAQWLATCTWKPKVPDWSPAATILAKIYEANFNVSVKQRTTGKVQFQFLNSFLLVLTKFSFWEEDWALGYNSMKI